jgi:hypothetical protein
MDEIPFDAAHRFMATLHAIRTPANAVALPRTHARIRASCVLFLRVPLG